MNAKTKGYVVTAVIALLVAAGVVWASNKWIPLKTKLVKGQAMKTDIKWMREIITKMDARLTRLEQK